ncbi:alpha/beta fold hydrolase [Daejeonella oryzae]|uniref:alpha/beta fold hydrolase n=1 Tax=Daejeonella oryzae TaxID=1122943 RepID=UPI00041AA248|nr:alpha/beta fold hydrolase [Daejeonella oryzae]
MKHILSTVLFALFICFASIAQTIRIEGEVLDSKTRQPIPYPTIGVKGKSIGTVADEKGLFNFKINETTIVSDESIIVSSIGYKSEVISLEKFKEGKIVIDLTPTIKELETVIIQPKKSKRKIFGRTGSSTFMTANMFTERNLIDDNLGKEQARIVDVDKECLIRDFSMYVVLNHFKSVKFRLNFYSVKNGEPYQLINDDDILFDVSQKSGWVKVDLRKYDLFIKEHDKIAVAIQWIKSIKTDSTSRAFNVSVIPTPLQSMFFRNKSHLVWEKISPANLAFNITVDSFKGSKKDGQLTDKDEHINGNIKSYLQISKFQEEARSSEYGNNRSAGRYIAINNSNIYFETYGSGEPLLLLHGNSQSISAFYKQIAEFAKYFRVIAVDTRAHGNSSDTSTQMLSYDVFANDMKQFLDSLHITHTNILGWSDGGNTALIMAMKYPLLIKRMVVMGAVLSPSGVEQALLDSIKSNSEKLKNNTDKKSEYQLRILSMLLNEPHIYADDLKSIKARVLVMAGERDMVKPLHTQEIKNNIKDSKLFIVPDASHYAPTEVPGLFNKVVIDFLRK